MWIERIAVLEEVVIPGDLGAYILVLGQEVPISGQEASNMERRFPCSGRKYLQWACMRNRVRTEAPRRARILRGLQMSQRIDQKIISLQGQVKAKETSILA